MEQEKYLVKVYFRNKFMSIDEETRTIYLSKGKNVYEHDKYCEMLDKYVKEICRYVDIERLSSYFFAYNCDKKINYYKQVSDFKLQLISNSIEFINRNNEECKNDRIVPMEFKLTIEKLE